MPDLMTSLNALSLSGIPDALFDRVTVKIGEHAGSLQEFIEVLKHIALEQYRALSANPADGSMSPAERAAALFEPAE